jgi:2-keto-4-pentenoate hydratase/2-oxohepta-3-ene-1,7-dioic acid hydratase in catechol pathway
MKLMSYVNEGVQWGIVIEDADSGTSYVLDPERAQRFLDGYCSDRTIGYFSMRPTFFTEPIPKTMVAFLETGDAGMASARALKDFVERFIVQSDRSLLIEAACPLDKVEFLPPIPEPRLLWGLVGNVPSFSRSKWEMKQLQLVPQAHHRPIGTVVGHNRPCGVYEGAGGNAEFAFVIGKKGRNISMGEALRHVAGYTVVNDMYHSLYAELVHDRKSKGEMSEQDKEEMDRIARETGSPLANEDIYAILSSSWAGKIADRMCGLGPWITTSDEVGDPYDLLVTTRRNGERLGRGHTCAMLTGIERAIVYYSSFATLYPGDVIHLGSVAKDGFGFMTSQGLPENTIQSEIENVGTLNYRATMLSKEEERARPPVPRNVPEISDATSLEVLDGIRLRNVYNVYGNSTSRDAASGLSPRPFPRFLCAPGSSLGTAAAETWIPTEQMRASAEFCAVIGKTARGLRTEDVSSHILGYSPLISLENVSLTSHVEHSILAFERERALPEIYGRWGDGFNIVSEAFVRPENLKRDNRLTLTAAGETRTYDTADYFLWFDDVIAYISTYITLFPGDVVTLGNLGACIDLATTLGRAEAVELSLQAGDIGIAKTIRRTPTQEG